MTNLEALEHAIYAALVGANGQKSEMLLREFADYAEVAAIAFYDAKAARDESRKAEAKKKNEQAVATLKKLLAKDNDKKPVAVGISKSTGKRL